MTAAGLLLSGKTLDFLPKKTFEDTKNSCISHQFVNCGIGIVQGQTYGNTRKSKLVKTAETSLVFPIFKQNISFVLYLR